MTSTAFASTISKLDKLIADLEVRVGAPHRPSPFESIKVELKESKAQDSKSTDSKAKEPAGNTDQKPKGGDKKNEKKPEGGDKKAEKKPEEKKTEGKKEEPATKGGEGEVPTEGLLEDFARLDIRVGNIVECWVHPDSDKLYCEKIENLSDMKGLVLVLANLKPRKLGGFPSHGMVMCAGNADHTVVELLRPPAGAKVGERVTLEGYDKITQAKEKPLDDKKHKTIEKTFPYLKTNGSLEATYNNLRLLTSAGTIKAASLKNS
eukprot:CAMPEP_0176467436 /NCGR_PEP_ID=MMETSP0127-20121128/38461_1 /TAXON_ID=938130 /ORGANISM="Platyophrya macrostoma, Strain WH" /LENGTH=262 /DNA_ID=CAMNT_0017860743 /DNA_START=17 /DNA_END=801 /DNA_ORIENTATION=+